MVSMMVFYHIDMKFRLKSYTQMNYIWNFTIQYRHHQDNLSLFLIQYNIKKGICVREVWSKTCTLFFHNTSTIIKTLWQIKSRFITTWFWIISLVCKGTCVRHKAQKPLGVSRYNLGQKRCSICEIFINWDGRHCPCCSYVLRTKPKGTQTRHRLMVLQQIKRI